MKEFIEENLGLETQLENADFSSNLPMIYSALYDFRSVRMENMEWVMLIPKEQIHLSQLRKHHRQIQKILHMHCALYLKHTNQYSKKTMIAEKIPFIIEGRDIYLPFLGILLSSEADRKLKPVQKISFLTQRLILTAIYEKWSAVNVTQAAQALSITKMSASRCFDEIEYFDLPILGMKGRSRVIQMPSQRERLWNQIKDCLRNPVISTFDLSEDIRLDIMGGLSALAEYSMIEDNAYPTYIIPKKEIGGVNLRDKLISPKDNNKGCRVQEVGYFVSFPGGKTIDPLSLVLSLSEEEKNDERVEKSVREMLKEYVW